MANGKPSPRSEFNVSKRADERRKRRIVINNKEFFPAPETTETRAEERQLSRQQRVALARQSELAESTLESDLDEIEKLEDEVEEVLYKQMAVQLVDEQGTRPDPAFLSAHLPMGDVTALFEFLSAETDTPDPS